MIERPSSQTPTEKLAFDETKVHEAKALEAKALEAKAHSTLQKRAALLGVGVLMCGFVAGYGYGVGVNRQEKNVLQQQPKPRPFAPIVKGMRLAPDGRQLAFAAVYDSSQRSSRFVVDVESGRFSAQETPVGWQDYVVAWNRAGNQFLVKRERIPRPVAEASAGFYEQKILPGQWPRLSGDMEAIKPKLPSGETVIAGFWDDRDRFVVKTKREPKKLLVPQNQKLATFDSSSDDYLQNRVVTENGRSVAYVVRNVGAIGSPLALFRVENGVAKNLSGDLADMVWAYISDDSKWMIAARYADNQKDWQWSLYHITPAKATKVKTAQIPGDVIGVYWSPDFKTILGANGESLWLIDIPTLKARKLGDKRLSNADDATWSVDSKSVYVATDGKLWHVDVKSGAMRVLWTFPDQYWQ